MTLTQQVAAAEAQVEIAADVYRRSVDCALSGWKIAQASRSLDYVEGRLAQLYALQEMADAHEDAELR